MNSEQLTRHERHQIAMQHCWHAKMAEDIKDFKYATKRYKLAADDLYELARDYIEDKVPYEPTNWVVIRAAAYTNLLAGELDKAEKLAKLGLQICKDGTIITQLRETITMVAEKKKEQNERA